MNRKSLITITAIVLFLASATGVYAGFTLLNPIHFMQPMGILGAFLGFFIGISFVLNMLDFDEKGDKSTFKDFIGSDVIKYIAILLLVLGLLGNFLTGSTQMWSAFTDTLITTLLPFIIIGIIIKVFGTSLGKGAEIGLRKRTESYLKGEGKYPEDVKQAIKWYETMKEMGEGGLGFTSRPPSKAPAPAANASADVAAMYQSLNAQIQAQAGGP